MMEQTGSISALLVFVVGLPGSGKSVQCQRVAGLPGFYYVSIKDLLVTEVQSHSEVGEIIQECISQSRLVPKEVLVPLLWHHLLTLPAQVVFIEGFPRDVEQAVYLEQSGVKIDYILYYECTDDTVLINRLTDTGLRGYDASLERLQVHQSTLYPVVHLYAQFDVVHTVNALLPPRDVYQLTLDLLKPRVMCVTGPVGVGKTTVAAYICDKYGFYRLTAPAYQEGNSSETVVKRLVKKLHALRKEKCVLIDGFPDTLSQIRLFEVMYGQPSSAIVLNYRKDEAFERLLSREKHSGMRAAELTKRYASYEAKSLSVHFSPCSLSLSTGTTPLLPTLHQIDLFLHPEILLIRGELDASFLSYLVNTEGFRLINATNLLRLWRHARGLSRSEQDQHLADDLELVSVLKDVVYSRANHTKIAIYNFALSSLEIVKRFEEEIAGIKGAFYLFNKEIRDFDSVSLYLYSTHRLFFADISMNDGHLPLFRAVFSRYKWKNAAKVVFIYGIKASGKTYIANLLKRLYGFKICQFDAIKTDEDANFTQYCESFRDFLLKNRGEKLVFEGIPPMPLGNLSVRAGFEVLDLVSRWETLVNEYLAEFCVAVIRTEVSLEECLRRHEGDSEEVTSTATQTHYLAQTRFLPCLTHTVSTASATLTDLQLSRLFAGKLILIQTNINVKSTVLRHCFGRKSTFVDFEEIKEKSEPINALFEYLSEKRVENTVILYNFPFPRKENAAPGQLFAYLQALEDRFGRLQALFQVGEVMQDDIAHESLPIRTRRMLSKDTSTLSLDGEMSTNLSLLPSPEANPMWNQAQCAGLTLVFQYYKGQKAHFERMTGGNVREKLEEALRTVAESGGGKRWNLQLVGRAEDTQEVLGSSALEYFEPLPLDISTLGGYSRRLASVFTNPRARVFHTQRLSSYTVPFNCFFTHFKSILQSAGLTITVGLRRAIQTTVDLNGTACVSAEDVDRLFNQWESEQGQRDIIALARKLDTEAKTTGDTIGYKLLLAVVQTEPDPVTHVQSFSKGDVFIITDEGCPQSTRFAADRVTYAGKEGPIQTNDIVFKAAETRVRSHHFSILSRKTGYFLVDGGSRAGVRLLIEDVPVVLFTNAVLCFGSSMCVVCSTAQRNMDWVSDFIHILDYSQNEETTLASTPELELSFLSGPLFGRSFRLSPYSKEVYTVGSNPESDIVLKDLASPEHAWLLHGDYGWAVVDMQSLDGTWVSVNMHDRVLAGRPSPPLRIRNGMVMDVPGTRFKCVFKSDINFKVQISDFVEVRNVDFHEIYELGTKMGAGAHGQVFQCRHKGTGRLLAVKILGKARVDRSTLFEIVALKRLDHPNIIRVLDLVDDDRCLYIVTELLSGGELFTQIVSKGHLSEAQASDVMQQLLSAVSFIHSRSVLHRDIKPENLMYETTSEDSALKLIDFGAAGVLLPTFKTVGRIGTPYYMAPEVIHGKYDAKCDVWSCGVVLYILLSGRPPFRGRSEQEIFSNIQSGPPSFSESTWKSVSKPVKSLIKYMLNPDPKQRPSASEVLQHPWVTKQAHGVDYDKPIAGKSLTNLKAFNASNKLQQAILIFIANNLLSAEERNYAMQLFRGMDKDGSGFLSKEELKEGFKKAHFEVNEESLQEVLREVDANMSGMVDYSEFLTAVISMQSLISRERLNFVFSLFDTDGSGDITASELKSLLGQSEERWLALLDQVDNNKDGKIDIFEFKSLMLSYIS